MPALGYIPDAYDRRNLNFPMRNVLPTTSTRQRKTWPSSRWHGDQGQTSSCVGFAFTHLLKDYPVGQGRSMPDPATFAYQNYREAQQIDPWNGGASRADDGTVLDAMGRVLLSKEKIKSFHFALTMDEIIVALLEHGPVVFGTRWFSGMTNPTPEGIMTPTGAMQGGHAYKGDAIDLRKGLIRIKNSWSTSWSRGGYAFMSLEDFDDVIFRRNGECCLVVEK